MIKLHTCERNDKAEVSETNCINRQAFLAKKTWKNGYANGQYRDIQGLCEGCETGIALYQEFLKGDKFEMNGKPDEKLKECSDCGKMLPADLVHFDVANRASDGLTKACRSCRGTDKKSLSVENKPVETLKHNEISKKPETKPCELDGCSELCVRGPKENDGAWSTRKYHSQKCKTEAKRRRSVGMRRTTRAAVSFNRDEAEKIARQAADYTLKMFGAFIKDEITHDQILAVAIVVGIESQRRAAGAA